MDVEKENRFLNIPRYVQYMYLSDSSVLLDSSLSLLDGLRAFLWWQQNKHIKQENYVVSHRIKITLQAEQAYQALKKA